MYFLFLDDERQPQDVTWVELPHVLNWEVVYDYNTFVDCVEQHGVPLFVTFDHDLADEHYSEYHAARLENRGFNYDRIAEKTGYDCVKFLVDYCHNHDVAFPDYACHTMNPVGKTNMEQYIQAAKKAGYVN